VKKLHLLSLAGALLAGDLALAAPASTQTEEAPNASEITSPQASDAIACPKGYVSVPMGAGKSECRKISDIMSNENVEGAKTQKSGASDEPQTAQATSDRWDERDRKHGCVHGERWSPAGKKCVKIPPEDSPR
jgi:hypothetical protein